MMRPTGRSPSSPKSIISAVTIMPSRSSTAFTVIADAPTRSTVTCLAGQSHVFRDLDPLADPFVVRNHEVALPANAELADHGGMGAAQHAHDLAVRFSIALDAADLGDHAIAVHRAGGGLLGDIDVAAQAGNGHLGNHEAVAVAMDVQPSHGELAADAGRGVVPGSRFDDLPALGQAVQLCFQLLAGGAGARSLPQQLFEVRHGRAEACECARSGTAPRSIIGVDILV